MTSPGRCCATPTLRSWRPTQERYRDYVAGVRREYAHLDDATFREGRAEILRALLAKPTLFHTRHAREAWEAAARANLEREVAELSAPGAP